MKIKKINIVIMTSTVNTFACDVLPSMMDAAAVYTMHVP